MITRYILPFLLLTFTHVAFSAEMNPVLQGVVNVLPDVPMVVRGDLIKRDARGKIAETYRVEMVLDWKADLPTARYTIRDAFGSSLQHLAITWPVAGEPEYQYFEGQPLKAAALPPLNQPILDTDLTWLDLSLSFLWWPGGESKGQEKVRGRTCDVIDVPAPTNQVQQFDGVRLWVEPKIGIVMRADGFNEKAELKRRMEVKSFKKIRNRWIIKDVEFLSFPEKTKTTLLVRDAEVRERFELPDRDQLAWPDESIGEAIDTLPAMAPED
jgi:Outer membrane lipoprotein-sorting protein